MRSSLHERVSKDEGFQFESLTVKEDLNEVVSQRGHLGYDGNVGAERGIAFSFAPAECMAVPEVDTRRFLRSEI